MGLPGRVALALALVLSAGFADAFAPAALPFASSHAGFSQQSLANRGVPVLRPSLRSNSKVLQVYSQLPGVKSSARPQVQPSQPVLQGFLDSARKFVNAGALCVLLGIGLLTALPETSTAQLPGLELPPPEVKVRAALPELQEKVEMLSRKCAVCNWSCMLKPCNTSCSCCCVCRPDEIRLPLVCFDICGLTSASSLLCPGSLA
jgi:hypothetical protein